MIFISNCPINAFPFTPDTGFAHCSPDSTRRVPGASISNRLHYSCQHIAPQIKMAPFTSDDYHIGWICALPEERAAARAMLDEEHAKIQGQDRQDSNSYFLGRIHDHNVVIAVLPSSIDGTSAAAAAASNRLRRF